MLNKSLSITHIQNTTEIVNKLFIKQYTCILFVFKFLTNGRSIVVRKN